MVLFIVVALLLTVAAGHLKPRQIAGVPDFVTKYAPLVYLDQNELYFPSDIQAQLNNTFPALNFTAAPNVSSPLLLSNLDQLNTIGNCTSYGTCPIFLTSKDNVTNNPPWLYGVLPDPVTLETVDAKSCAIIINDHGNGIVDAFYMYFYAFNLGETVLGLVQGDHVGDWEHSMLRFVNGTPVSVWLSQHNYGQAFAFESLSKNGTRPFIYSAIGSHANFAVPGLHARTLGPVQVDDFTSAGPLWDPTLSAYYYSFTASSPSNGTFVPLDASIPASWLYFLGQWGDKQYLDSDPRQVNLANLNISWKYESGPTGPLDKQLNRTDVCPDVTGTNCTTLSSLPATSGTSIPATVMRSTVNPSQATGTLSSPTKPSTSESATPSATGKSDGRSLKLGRGILIVAVLCWGFI